MSDTKEKLSDSEKWDGTWDSKKGLEIQLGWKNEKDFTKLKNKFKNWILDRIMVFLCFVWILFLFYQILFTNAVPYAIASFIIYFQSTSFTTMLFYIFTLVVVLAFCVYLWLYTIEKEES